MPRTTRWPVLLPRAISDLVTIALARSGRMPTSPVHHVGGALWATSAGGRCSRRLAVRVWRRLAPSGAEADRQRWQLSDRPRQLAFTIFHAADLVRRPDPPRTAPGWRWRAGGILRRSGGRCAWRTSSSATVAGPRLMSSRRQASIRRVRVVYYRAIRCCSLVETGEREAARAALSQPSGRPLVGSSARSAIDGRNSIPCFRRGAICAAVRSGTPTRSGGRVPSCRCGVAAGRGGDQRSHPFRRLSDRRSPNSRGRRARAPARYEACGLAVREALSRGIPALVTAAAGVAEQYPPELGGLLLDDPENPAELQSKLLAWRRDLEPGP